MATVRIVPRLDEVEDGGFSLTLRAETMLDEQFAFECCVEALAHRVVIAVASRTHRRPNTGGFAAKSERDRSVLRSLIGMVNNGERLATKDRHVERGDHELLAHVIRHRPADDATAEDVEHDGKIEKAAPCRNVRDVSNPELIRRVGGETALYEIGRRSSITIANRRDSGFATRSALKCCDCASTEQRVWRRREAVIEQFCVNARTSISRTRSVKDCFDAITQ